MSTRVLFDAIRKKDRDAVRELIREGVDLDDKRGSLFALACQIGDVAIVSMLLDAGALIDDDASDWALPLHQAVEHKRTDVVRLLLQRGANVNRRDSSRLTPLFYACDAETIAALVSAGADLLARDDSGYRATALHFAAYNGDVKIVELLMSAGCDVSALTSKGEPPLTWAWDDKIARAFVSGGADVDGGPNCSRSPLISQFVHNRLDAARFLLVCGASPNTIDENGTALIERSFYGYNGENIACMLYAAGAERRTSRFDPAQLSEKIAAEKKAMTRVQIDLIRIRAMEICVALQEKDISAHELMAIIEFACEPFSNCVRLGAKWDIVVCVKHFKERQAKAAAVVL